MITLTNPFNSGQDKLDWSKNSKSRKMAVCRAEDGEGGRSRGEKEERVDDSKLVDKIDENKGADKEHVVEEEEKQKEGEEEDEETFLFSKKDLEILSKMFEDFIEVDDEMNLVVVEDGYDTFMVRMVKFLTEYGNLVFTDVDGNPVTEWTQSRVETFTSYRLSPRLEPLEIGKPKPGLEREIIEKVFAGSPFNVEGFLNESPLGLRVFFGKLTGRPSEALDVLSSLLKKNYPDLFLALGPFDYLVGPPDPDLVACIVYPRDGYISVKFIGYLFVPGVLLSLFFAKQALYADPAVVSGIGAAWTATLYPLGIGLVMAAPVLAEILWAKARKLPPPENVCPVVAPGFGLVTMSSIFSCILPDRIAVLDWSLVKSVASGLASVSLLLASQFPIPLSEISFQWLASFGFPEPSGIFSDVVLLRSDFFAHSALLTELFIQLSKATFTGVNNETVVAINPFALAGLVGLNATAVGLLPIRGSEGGNMVDAILKDEVLSNILGMFFYFAIIFSLFFNFSSMLLCVVLAMPFLAAQECIQFDMLTKPDRFRSSLAVVLMISGLVTMLPPSVFNFFVVEGPGPVAEQFLSILGLA